MAGVSLPVEPLRRQLVPTEPFDRLPKRFPMVIDMSTGFHFRREGAGILMLEEARVRDVRQDGQQALFLTPRMLYRHVVKSDCPGGENL